MNGNEPIDLSRPVRSPPERLITYGPPGADRLAQMHELQQQASHYLRRLALRTPYPVVNRVLIGVNVAVFALMVLTGVSLTNPTLADLRAWGALSPSDVLAGQPWRMFTAMFLHIGAVHLLLNMWALWSLGPFVERLLGNAGFLLTYLASGLAGSLASLFWNVNVVSAGASGAIFGIVGGLLGFCIKQRGVLPAPLLAPLRSAGLTFVIINVALGMSMQGIDMAAHLGGLLGGAICGFVLSQPLDAPARPATLRAFLFVLAVALALFGGIQAFEHLQGDTQGRLAAVDFLDRAASRLKECTIEFDAGQISAAAFAAELERDILPANRHALRLLPADEAVPPEDRADLAHLRKLLIDLDARLMTLTRALHTNDRKQIDRAIDQLPHLDV